MAGHNAFQRNAFQRNAFQIVYEFAPTVDGGLVLGGNVTARFSTHREAIVSGGLVLGGNVTAHFTPGASHYVAIPSGGLVLGGNVRARFQPGVRPRRLGTAGRVWNNILRRPKKYRAKVSGGLVLGGSVRTGLLQNTPISVGNEVHLFIARVSGGLVLGGKAETQFISLPVIYISQPGPPISQPDPDPVSYKAVSTLGGGVGIRSGVRAAFRSNPPPPEPRKSWPFFERHKAQQLEEDELLLMDIL